MYIFEMGAKKKVQIKMIPEYLLQMIENRSRLMKPRSAINQQEAT